MSRPWTTVVLALAGLFGLVALVASLLYPVDLSDSGGIKSTIGVAVWGCSYLVIGGLLTWRRPTLVIPWILVALGIDVCSSAIVQAATIARPELNDRFPGVGISLFLVFGCLAGMLAHLYPTGRAPSVRWQWMVRLLIACTVGTAIGQLAGVNPTVSGIPTKVAAVTLALGYFVGLSSAVPSVAVRMHRATGVERAQLKWFLFGLVGGVIGWFGPIPILGAGLAALLPVLAIVVALLRYRLYDIDRVVSRTASYLIVTGFVLAVYFAAIAAATHLLNGAGPLAVAAATLLAAALFRPALSRVQRAVDRRFNRSKYDATRILDRFGQQLRHELDADSIENDLVLAVQETLQPVQTSLWIRSK